MEFVVQAWCRRCKRLRFVNHAKLCAECLKDIEQQIEKAKKEKKRLGPGGGLIYGAPFQG